MSAPSRKRVAVLISGRGSNMGALAEAARDAAYPGEIVAVMSNRPDAGGLDLARRYGIEAVAVDQRQHGDDRTAHEAAVLAALDRIRPDVVCLAGYMRLLSAEFVARFSGRLINIHPSLLPLFPGLDTHQRALAAGMRIHGCTVHFVTEAMDEGPIIAQAAIGVEAGDTADTLATRLLAAEHRLYPHALKLVLEGSMRLEDGRAVFTAAREPGARPATDVGGASMLVSPSL